MRRAQVQRLDRSRCGTFALGRKLRAAVAPCLALAGALLAAHVAHAAEFVDDAGRRVELPAQVDRVFAAGAPAEILLYTLVPEMLGGLNHKPAPDALELMPPAYRSLPQIVNL